jgi:hypothetical protein
MIDYSEFNAAIKHITKGAGELKGVISESSSFESSESHAKCAEAYCLELSYKIWCATVGYKSFRDIPSLGLLGHLMQQVPQDGGESK